MALREVSVDGVLWSVWNVIPSGITPRGVRVRRDYAEGWLCMQAGEVKLRVAPVPAEWETWEDERLAAEVRAAGSGAAGE